MKIQDLAKYKHADEATVLRELLQAHGLSPEQRRVIGRKAANMVQASREMRDQQGTLDAFLGEFGLSNAEGVTLMCLAEALLRVPDADTQDDLIAERIAAGDWKKHLGHSDKGFVNAGVWALMLSGRLVEVPELARREPGRWLQSLINRSSEPLIRQAINQAMKIMGGQFVFARDIEEAIRRQRKRGPEALFSFDMLGEGARTAEAAERYTQAYAHAIRSLGEASKRTVDWAENHSISIKLSALHPRYESRQWDRLNAELLPRLRELALLAAEQHIQLTVDAEEADRLELSLHLLDALWSDPALRDYHGLGLAVQAYQKRALPLCHWLIQRGEALGRRIPVRLVKGAYWDTEIKHSQVQAHPDFPVFSRKAGTDLSYLACAQTLLSSAQAIYPQFATHNAHTLAAVQQLGRGKDYEFQRLHGMGDLVYAAAEQTLFDTPPRIRTYAPVGQHRDLLPYLVRRLLENGANSSFINRFMDASVAVEEIVADPIRRIEESPEARAEGISRAAELYPGRPNSRGLDLEDQGTARQLEQRLSAARRAGQEAKARYEAGVWRDGQWQGGDWHAQLSPADPQDIVGRWRAARDEDGAWALAQARAAQPAWNARGGQERQRILNQMADALEARMEDWLELLSREAGRSLDDGIAEVREAVDFCRYYGRQAALHFSAPQRMPGPSGERNELSLCGRGVFLCISPWNFPLAIFTGQIAAALAAGNTVLAKPADQTPLIAAQALRCFQQAGLPPEVLHLLPGPGARVAGPLIEQGDIAGIAFTGSTATARRINQQLAAREGAILPLIAETGGLNAMVVDSTALLEQVCDDVIRSAFHSAGQRCSALRILLVQEDIADDLIAMLRGAMAQLGLGHPAHPASDIGPIIDLAARQRLQGHCDQLPQHGGRLLAECPVPDNLPHGASYFAPRLYEIDRLDRVQDEVFGPILHLLRYRPAELPTLMDELKATGFGLTFGVHSRLSQRADQLFAASQAGNVYINRNITGAVVESQAFGGSGRSGTGPKAGGPHYVLRFAQERVRSENTTAIGGNTELFNLQQT